MKKEKIELAETHIDMLKESIETGYRALNTIKEVLEAKKNHQEYSCALNKFYDNLIVISKNELILQLAKLYVNASDTVNLQTLTSAKNGFHNPEYEAMKKELNEDALRRYRNQHLAHINPDRSKKVEFKLSIKQAEKALDIAANYVEQVYSDFGIKLIRSYDPEYELSRLFQDLKSERRKITND